MREAMQADKRIFLTLDGLRGIAAIMIVLFHSRAIVGHFHPASAYLSVDLFFALSGCVLEASYRGRLAEGLSTRAFMRIRFIRLWPLFALSLMIGLAFALVRLAMGVGGDTPASIALALVTGLAMLPSPSLSGHDWVMPLNVAGWSLVLELAINALYAWQWRRLSNRLLWLVVTVSGLVLTAASLAHGGVDMGSTWGSVAGGLVRVLYSFSLGVLIFRAYDGRVRRGWVAALVPLLLIPILATGGGGPLFDLACALFVLPLLVWAGLRLEPAPGLDRLFRWAGLTSYALYVLHGPVLQFAKLAIFHYWRPRTDAVWMAGLAAIAALVLLSAAVDRWYDTPVRRKLSAHLRRRAEAARGERAMTAS
jgi:peptidoglycan/LPS O-acetylase OafA/YrhL